MREAGGPGQTEVMREAEVGEGCFEEGGRGHKMIPTPLSEASRRNAALPAG